MRDSPNRPGWSSVLLVALLVSSADAPLAQDPPLPPSRGTPEMLERQRAEQQLPAPPPTPTLDKLLAELGLTQADVARRRAMGERPLPASSGSSRDELAQGRAAPPGAPQRTPTLPEVLEVLRKEPRGPEMLERARRGGARIPGDPGRDDAPAWFAAAVDGGRGKGDAGAWAGEDPPQFPVMTATKRQMANVAGMGSLLVNGHLPLWTSDLPQMGPFLRYAVSSYFGPVDVRPAVAIGLTVATEGYYLISVTATAAKASLRLGNLPWPYRAVAGGEWDHTLTLGMTSGYSSYPVVVKLTAGAPYNFYWTIDANPASGATVWVSEVSVYKL